VENTGFLTPHSLRLLRASQLHVLFTLSILSTK